MLASPQCCHGVAQLVNDSAEQQRDEEVGQLAGGQIDTRDLKGQPGPTHTHKHTHTAQIFCIFDLIFIDFNPLFNKP